MSTADRARTRTLVGVIGGLVLAVAIVTAAVVASGLA
ncbi:hypothetical protein BJ978_001120 [Agromyces terreus]|uniref:Uncharacterized protein n=1 Tax=Agromyces terreus TaxID=424795 RepID=A0A9X2H5K9_9MICO|nr:hypothetical protein [Agromyces terreus]